MSSSKRNGPSQGAVPESCGGDTDQYMAPTDVVPAWPPAEGTAVEPVTYDELQRRRRAHHELNALLQGAA